MIIKSPEREDIPAMRELWKAAFGDTDEFLNKFFETGFSFRRSRILEKDGRVASALYWFDCLWEGKKVAYIYAVATDKTFRGKGMCRALIENTHSHLKTLGYAGAALVPGNKGLFSLYEKFGYQSFCPMETKKISCQKGDLSLQVIDADGYNALRKKYLPANSILQEGETLAFLSTFARFYQGEDCLFSAYEDAGVLHICEYFGKEEALANIDAKEVLVRLPGGNTPTAMYLDFTGEKALPAYLGITLN